MRTSGVHTFKMGHARLQVYWPDITTRIEPIKELHMRFDTNLRLVLDKRKEFYTGVGFQLLGFGLGFDYLGSTPSGEVGK